MLGITARITIPGIITIAVVSLSMLLSLSWYLEVQSSRMELLTIEQQRVDCAAQNAALAMQTSILTLQLQGNIAQMARSVETLANEIEPPWMKSSGEDQDN